MYERTRNELADKEKSLRGLQQSQVRSTFGDRSALGIANGEEEALRQVIGDAQQVYKVLVEAANQQNDEVDSQQVTEAGAETSASGLRRPKSLQIQLQGADQQQAAGSRPQSALLFSKSSGPLASARLSGQSLAEQALSSVQTAFNKRQLQVQELITKLSTARENLNNVRKCVRANGLFYKYTQVLYSVHCAEQCTSRVSNRQSSNHCSAANTPHSKSQR